MPAPTSSKDLWPSSVSIPPAGTKRFWVVVHIWPEYSDRVKARLPQSALKESVESMMTALTPAFSVKTVGLGRVLLQPLAELAAAGEVDQLHLGPGRQRLGQAVARALDGQGDQVRVEAGLGEHLAADIDR